MSEPIEKHLQKLLTTEGFIEKFYSMCPDYFTHEEAYEATERLYERVFGQRRYASFDSFRKIRDKLIKTQTNGIKFQ